MKWSQQSEGLPVLRPVYQILHHLYHHLLSSSHQVRHMTHILKCTTCTPRQGHLVPQHAGRSVPQASANGSNILKRILGVTFSFQRIVSQRYFDVNHLREPAFPAHPCNPSNSQNQGTASLNSNLTNPKSIPTYRVHLGRQAFSVAYSSFPGHPECFIYNKDLCRRGSVCINSDICETDSQ